MIFYSAPFVVKFGIRQGSVLSPFLFSVYLNDISESHALIPRSCVILYADILLTAPSIGELQRMLHDCEM